MDADAEARLNDAVVQEFTAASYPPEHIKSVLDRQAQLKRQESKGVKYFEKEFDAWDSKYGGYRYDLSENLGAPKTWMKIHRKHLLPATLVAYDLPWDWDEVQNPEQKLYSHQAMGF
ncbi:uncharacterized protein BJX67DRAFT_62855 [Aspergillus lucknowensis]|uniref:Uncharacterized protein n=1 Tax=Aspergillus lucknowensis TaxID=176173 RepID=A0ABR4LUE0_9EURO